MLQYLVDFCCRPLVTIAKNDTVATPNIYFYVGGAGKYNSDCKKEKSIDTRSVIPPIF